MFQAKHVEKTKPGNGRIKPDMPAFPVGREHVWLCMEDEYGILYKAIQEVVTARG